MGGLQREIRNTEHRAHGLWDDYKYDNSEKLYSMMWRRLRRNWLKVSYCGWQPGPGSLSALSSS